MTDCGHWWLLIRDTTVRQVGCLARYHAYAVDDRTHRQTESTASTVFGHTRQMSLWIECDRLIAAVVAGHVALATIDTHLFVDECYYMLFVIQAVVVGDLVQCQTDYVLDLGNLACLG